MFNACLLLLSTATFAQMGTSLEEYRYLTKGYPYQEELGLDHTKEGYSFQTLHKDDALAFVGMYQNNDSAPRAVLAILRPGTKQAKYLCIPNGTAEADILKMYKQDRDRLLATTQARKQFEESSRMLIFKALSRPANVQSGYQGSGASSSLYSRANGAPVNIPAPDANKTEIELTSKGIPVTPSSYDVPRSYNQENITAADMAQSKPAVLGQAAAPPLGANGIAINTRVQSSLEGQLEKRSLAQPIQVLEQHYSRGKVVIKVCVDGQGDVVTAKFTQRGSTTFDKKLKNIALKSARNAKFSQSTFAEECGYIAYSFQ